jgi:multidrug efflux pump
MKLWNLAVDNRVAVYILMLIIVLFGAQAYLGMPREAAPDITIPIVIVAVPYIGVGPSDIEGLVTQPIERELKALKDVKKITSQSAEGISTISVEFNSGVDIDEALRRTRDKVNSTRSKLPSDILEPIVREINLSEFPIMYVAIGGDIGLARLKDIGKDMKEKFEAIPGVIGADLSGGLEREVQINCDVNRMKGYDISFDDVTNAIRGENVTIPGGSIDDGTSDLTVRVPGEYKSTKPLEDIVVKMRNGQPIYIRDVASVDYSFEDRATYSRLNGKQVVTLAVKKRAGENMIRIADEVKRLTAEFQPTLPHGVELSITNDQSVNVKRMVAELENSIITGMFLVVMVLFMFFGVKNALLISTSIPLSMLMGFTILSLMGITLNMVVLFALVLVLGIVVDDAIVVIENIYRHQQEFGEDLIVAAKKATQEVALPVATSTFTTVAAFIPLLFWPGIVGDFMKYLPITLIATMLSSLFVAYVISPVQGSKFINYRKEIAKAKQALEHPSWWRRYNPFTVIYHFVDEKFFPAAQHNYIRVLGWTLKHKTATISGAFALLFGTIILFAFFNSGVEFFPNTQPTLVTANITMPVGTPVSVTNEVAHSVEKRIAAVPGFADVEFSVSTVGTSNNVFDFGGGKTSNKGSVAVNFYKKAMRKQSTFKTLEEIRTAVQGIPGADIKVEKQQMGPPVGAPVSIEISGDDFQQLRSLSQRVQGRIKNIPGLVDLRDDYNAGKPELQVVIDREKAALLEMSTAQIAMMVRTAINGTEASKYRVGEDEYKITVRLREDQRESADALEKLNVTFMNRRGQLLSVPLVSVANIVRSTGISNIKRKDLKRVITISADAQGRLSSDVLKDVQKTLAAVPMPTGYTINFAGEQEEQAKASAFLGKALLITLLLIFLIIVSEFNSVKIPTIIMVSVLLSLIGVLIGLMVTRTPFGVVMTGIGVIALAGIVVKNAIVLLDFTKHLREEQGMALDDALLEAGRVRLRPVILTAVATVLGVFPLATGIDFDWLKFHFVIGAESGDFWRSLGVAIMFGLTVSTFLTLVIVPTYYSWAEDMTASVSARFRRLFGKKDAQVG